MPIRVPRSVRAGQLLMVGEGAVWLVVAAYLLFTAFASMRFSDNGPTSVRGVIEVALFVWDLGCAGLVFAGALLGASAILGATSGMVLGRLGRAPRGIGLVLACLGVPVGAVFLATAGAVGAGRPDLMNLLSFPFGAPGPAAYSVLGLIAIVVNLGIIYCLGFDPGARDAFQRSEPAPPPVVPAPYTPGPIWWYWPPPPRAPTPALRRPPRAEGGTPAPDGRRRA
jgi:hypothetical protein